MTQDSEYLPDLVRTARTTADAIDLIAGRCGHEHTTFHILSTPSAGLDNPFVRTTYPAEWVQYYLLNNLAVVDPVVEKARRDRHSFCWSELPQNTAEPVLKTAATFGIGASGYSFVHEDDRGRIGLFSITASMAPGPWSAYVAAHGKTLACLLPDLHAKAVAEIATDTGDYPKLTPREYECLTQSAAGNSYSQIAVILSLSEHTVRSYLKIARIKLDCITLAQAVGKATRMGLI